MTKDHSATSYRPTVPQGNLNSIPKKNSSFQRTSSGASSKGSALGKESPITGNLPIISPSPPCKITTLSPLEKRTRQGIQQLNPSPEKRAFIGDLASSHFFNCATTSSCDKGIFLMAVMGRRVWLLADSITVKPRVGYFASLGRLSNQFRDKGLL